MTISRSLLLELKEILEQDYKVRLSMQEVLETAIVLLGFVETLAQIDQKTNCKEKTL